MLKYEIVEMDITLVNYDIRDSCNGQHTQRKMKTTVNDKLLTFLKNEEEQMWNKVRSDYMLQNLQMQL